MKTLYQRLSEENISKIKEASKLYPETVLCFTEPLLSNFSWGQIKMVDALSLYNILETVKPFDLETFINLFEND